MFASSLQVRASHRGTADIEGSRIDAMLIAMEKSNSVSHNELGITSKLACT